MGTNDGGVVSDPVCRDWFGERAKEAAAEWDPISSSSSHPKQSKEEAPAIISMSGSGFIPVDAVFDHVRIADGRFVLQPRCRNFATINPAASIGGRCGLRVLRQRVPLRSSKVRILSPTAGEVEIGDPEKDRLTLRVYLEVENVARVGLRLWKRTSILRREEMGSWPGRVVVDVFVAGNSGKSASWRRVGGIDCTREELLLQDSSRPCRYLEIELFSDGAGSSSISGEGGITKSPVLGGPVRRVFDRPFVTVAPKRTLAAALFLANVHYIAFGTRSPVALDTDMIRFGGAAAPPPPVASKSNYTTTTTIPLAPFLPNLVLIGGPSQNAVTKSLVERGGFRTKVLKFLPAEAHPDAQGFYHGGQNDSKKLYPFSFNGRVYAKPGMGVLCLVPVLAPAPPVETESAESEEWLLALILHGTDDRGLAAVLKLAEPTIPPMMRAPFQNHVPDFVVVEGRRGHNNVFAHGMGGVVAAGMQSNDWAAAAAENSFAKW